MLDLNRLIEPPSTGFWMRVCDATFVVCMIIGVVAFGEGSNIAMLVFFSSAISIVFSVFTVHATRERERWKLLMEILRHQSKQGSNHRKTSSEDVVRVRVPETKL